MFLSFLFHSLITISSAITIYSDRPKARFQEALRLWEKEKGEAVQYVEDNSESLLKRLAQGEKADILVLKDLMYLAQAKSAGLVGSGIPWSLYAQVTPTHRDPNQGWLPLSYRIRGLVYHTLNEAKISQIHSMDDLKSPHWSGTICTRALTHSYNVSFVAHWMAELGVSAARIRLSDWVSSFSKTVYSGDRAIIASVINEECEMGLVNSYYVVQALGQNPQLPVGFKILKDSRLGTHTNGTIAILLKGSSHLEDAIAFLEMMMRPEIQYGFARAHGDYPALTNVSRDYIPSPMRNHPAPQISWDELLEKMPDAYSELVIYQNFP